MAASGADGCVAGWAALGYLLAAACRRYGQSTRARDGAAAIPPSYCAMTRTHRPAHKHAHARTHPHTHSHSHARTCVRLGSAQDFERHRLQIQSGLKRLEKIGEEGAS